MQELIYDLNALDEKVSVSHTIIYSFLHPLFNNRVDDDQGTE